CAFKLIAEEALASADLSAAPAVAAVSAGAQVEVAKKGNILKRTLAGIFRPRWLRKKELTQIKGAEPTMLQRLCGPVVLLEVCRLNGRELDYAKALELCAPDAAGMTTMASLVKAVRACGMKAAGMELGVRQLPRFSERYQLILHMGNHFAVLKGIEGERSAGEQFRLVDDRGEVLLSKRRFLHQWDGYAVVVDGR
ncbi:cysteine peptidase family C39 domain-containing protein, partial [Candidatus Sumerlaeota bacterium]